MAYGAAIQYKFMLNIFIFLCYKGRYISYLGIQRIWLAEHSIVKVFPVGEAAQFPSVDPSTEKVGHSGAGWKYQVHHLNIITCDDEGGLCFGDRPDLIDLHRGLYWQGCPTAAPVYPILHLGGKLHNTDPAAVLVEKLYNDFLTTAQCRIRLYLERCFLQIPGFIHIPLYSCPRTAPILMKLGQNSVWCLIRRFFDFSALMGFRNVQKNPKRVHVLAAGKCFRLTGEPLVRTPCCRVSIDAY
eukprot:sb/3469025/